jgi:hypothetical protein
MALINPNHEQQPCPTLMVEDKNPTKPCRVSTDMPTSPLTKKHLHCALPPHQEQHWPNQWLAMLGGHEAWP